MGYIVFKQSFRRLHCPILSDMNNRLNQKIQENIHHICTINLPELDAMLEK
jgi:hypothetical protein